MNRAKEIQRLNKRIEKLQREESADMAKVFQITASQCYVIGCTLEGIGQAIAGGRRPWLCDIHMQAWWKSIELKWKPV